MSVWAAVLLMFGAYMVTAEVYPLDMAINSVDDMYKGCEDKMLKNVKNFLKNETNNNPKFRDAWSEAEMYYNGKWKRNKKRSLEKNEAVAVYAYTNAQINIYDELNKAVREQGPEYQTSFNYHSLHYFLTRAIQKLAAKQTEEKCHTSYRRTKVSFMEVPLNTKIRFGQFTSSSLHPLKLNKGKNLGKDFGEKSCFKIKTCFGADISIYSRYEDAEAEILIPPYEVFKVTKIETREKDKELPCEVVYTVESTREPVSNYNCALFKPSLSHG
ncbi:T-cell ecto-ADP-ribosyltransferase 2 [Oryzias melastigma]|uniref:NAD(P)(+)--arginine ADP-ribosyltransferase n=1 Tax=Oryzias melastigma TaxID=30732 RepID=A0A3B3DAZ9_ORYME|nr:T-cell ecto-ADP-ribosyltransferase 2 [Oryzias melastigma]